VQVSTSQLVLELVSGRRPTSTTTILEDDLQRLPASVFVKNNVSTVSSAILVPLAISKGASHLDQTSRFYTEEMLAFEAHASANGRVTLKAFSLHNATLLVRILERPDSQTFGSFKVADLELAKNSGHKMAHKDAFCGVDKWYDNHFAYDAFFNISLDIYKANFDEHRRVYHIFGDCKASKAKGPGTNIYVVDPTGDAVQLDGHWEHCPEGGSGDALANPCAQGACSKYLPATRCMTALEAFCHPVKLRNNTCTDCCYLKWKLLQEADCNNADVVNFCIKTDGNEIVV
jgi:hypothetical protein